MKRIKTLLFAVVFALTAILGCLPALQFADATMAARAAKIEYSFDSTFTISNADFSQNTATGSAPVTPSSWTGTAGTNVNSDSVKSGLITVKKYNENYKDWGFTDTDKIDNETSFTGGFAPEKALMINSGASDSIYKYTSADFTIKANSYLWLDFSAYASMVGKASVTFSSDDMKSLSVPIETNTMRWNDYHVLIKGSAYSDITTKMVINFGDESKYEDADGNEQTTHLTSSGALFVSKITTHLIKPDEYAQQKDKNNGDRFTFWEAKDYQANFVANPETDKDSWKLTSTSVNSGFSMLNVNSTSRFSNPKDNLTNPSAPFSTNGEVLMVTGTELSPTTSVINTKDTKDSTADINIPRFSFARISVWVNTVNLTGGTASVKISKGVFDDKDKVSDETVGETEVNSFTAQNVANWTKGWSEAVMYVKGSPFNDETVKLSLTAASLVGEVYFDNLSYAFITGADYEKYAAGDSAKKLEMSGSPVADKFTNGSFNNVGATKEKDVLLPAKDWTVDATSASVSGITGLDKAYYNEPTFKAKREKIGLTAYPASNQSGIENSLVIVHKEAAATVYTSAELATVTEKDANGADKATANTFIVVTLANRLTALPEEAKLQLLINDKVIAEMKNLKASEFSDYAFNIKQSASANYKYKLKIVIGDKAMASRQPTGDFWVKRVYAGPYTGSPLVVQNVDLSSDLFSSISDNDLFHSNFAWTKETAGDNVTMGFVKTREYPNGLESYKEMFKGAESEYAMLLSSATPAYIGFKQNFPITYASVSYTKVKIRLKTRGFVKGEGATIRLGDKTKFENVNTEYLRDFEISEDMQPEYDLKKYSGWREYVFYVNAGGTPAADSETATTTLETQLSIHVGNSLNALRTGTILVDSVRIETIDETSYNESIKVLDKGNKTPSNVVKVNLSDSVDSAQNGSTSTNTALNMDTMFIVLGSIFAGIVVILLLIMLIKAIRARRQVVKVEESSVSYDRSRVQQNYEKGKMEIPDESDEIIETVTQKPLKQARTVRGLKRQQERQKQESRAVRQSRRKGFTPEQEAALLSQVTAQVLPTDSLDDFKD